MAGTSSHLSRPGRTRSIQWAATVLLSLALSACGSGVLYMAPEPGPGGAGSWLQEGGDALGAAWLPDGPEPPLRLRWQQRLGKPPLGTPLLIGGMVLQWSKAPDLYAFDLASGTRLGKHRVDDPVCASGVMTGSRAEHLVVSVLSDDGELRALDRTAGGDVVWRRPGAVCAPLVVRGDTLYAAAEEGALVALDAADGKLLWRLPLRRPLGQAPTLEHDSLWVADGRGDLIAVRIDSGLVLWRAHLPAPARTRPVLDAAAGVVAVATANGGVHALRRADGVAAWSARVDGLSGELHAAGGRFVLGASDHQVYAFAAVDGALVWRYETGGIVVAGLSGTERTVYIPSADGWIHAVDASSGALRWRYQLDAPALTPAALAPGVLAVASSKGTLYVFQEP